MNMYGDLVMDSVPAKVQKHTVVVLLGISRSYGACLERCSECALSDLVYASS